MAAAPESPTPARAESVRLFPILEYQVEGNTKLQAIDIERAIDPYLGIRKSIKDIETARQALEKAYHDRGYQTVLVNIPQQQVSDGVVRLAVTEAPVGEMSIAGSKYHSLDKIRATVPQLQEGAVPNFNDVQKELAELNKSADMRVTPVLRASNTPGKVDVELDVKDTLPLHETVEVNNRYSANTTHTRVIAAVSYDNLFQAGQSVSLQYQTAPERPSDAKIWSLSYVIPTASGLAYALYAVKSDSNIAAVGDLNVVGNGKIYGLRIIDPLPSSSTAFYHSFTAGIDYKDFKQDVVLQGADDVPSPAKYPAFTLQYAGTWLGAQNAKHAALTAASGGRSSTNVELGVSFLIRGLYTDATQFAHKRAGAGPSYFILHPVIERQQVLPASWSIDAKVDGQLASGPLISNEQYGAGGVDSVRGYTETERLGDNGLRGSFELRTPQLFSKTSPGVTNSYAYVFTDAARVRILEPLPNQEYGYSLASLGIGLRFKAGGFTADFDGARAATSGYVTRAGAYSAQFRFNYSH